MKVNLNLGHIKNNYPYSITDICESFGKHKNTVYNWIEDGLKTLGNQRPILIHGSDLKEFLQRKQSSKKSKCQNDELYCVKCKKPQKPWGNIVDVFVKSKTKVNLQALCSVCNGKINKGFKVKNFDLIKKIFDVQKVHNSHLLECTSRTSNCDFN